MLILAPILNVIDVPKEKDKLSTSKGFATVLDRP